MKKGTIRLLTAATAFVLIATACGSDDDSGSADTAAPSESTATTEGSGSSDCEGVTVSQIGYSPLTLQFDYFLFTEQGMIEEAAKCGAEIVSNDPDNDAAAQVSGIESLLAGGAEAVAITSIDPVAVETAVDAARAADAFVISQVSTFEGADVYVGLPEAEFGRLSGAAAGAALLEIKPDEEMYQIAILNADSLGEGLLDRKQGTIDGLEESITNYEIVADVEAFAEETALSAVETILQGNPDVDLILTVNDPGSLGARSAVEASSLSLNDDVVIAGVGIDKRVLEGVLAGDFPGTVSPEPVATGAAMVRAIFDLSRGVAVEKDVQVPPQQITAENAQEYIDLLYPS